MFCLGTRIPWVWLHTGWLVWYTRPCYHVSNADGCVASCPVTVTSFHGGLLRITDRSLKMGLWSQMEMSGLLAECLMSAVLWVFLIPSHNQPSDNSGPVVTHIQTRLLYLENTRSVRSATSGAKRHKWSRLDCPLRNSMLFILSFTTKGGLKISLVPDKTGI